MSEIRAAHHVYEFIQDELNERDWSLSDLALRMIEINGQTEKEIFDQTQVNMLALRLLRASEHSEHGKKVVLGSQAEGLARAFGTSVGLWNNLHESWIKAKS